MVDFGSALAAGWGSAIPRQFGRMPNKGICRALCPHALVYMEAEPFTSKSCSLGHGAQQGFLEGRKETGGDDRLVELKGSGVHPSTAAPLYFCRLLRLPRPAYLRRRQGPGWPGGARGQQCGVARVLRRR